MKPGCAPYEIMTMQLAFNGKTTPPHSLDIQNRPEGFKILRQPLSLLKTGDSYVANPVYTCGC